MGNPKDYRRLPTNRHDAGVQTSASSTYTVESVEATVGTSPVSPVRQAVQRAGWPGVTLPETTLFSTTAYPVVTVTEATCQRLRDGVGPVLDPYTLDMWESWPEQGTHFPPAPLTIVGFVATGPPKRALDAVSGLRGFGSTMALTARRGRPMVSAEADARGVWMVGEDKVDVVGRHGPVETAVRLTWTRLAEEKLFATLCETLAYGTN